MEPASIHGFQRFRIEGQVGAAGCCAVAAAATTELSSSSIVAGGVPSCPRSEDLPVIPPGAPLQVFPGTVQSSTDGVVQGFVLFDLTSDEMEVGRGWQLAGCGPSVGSLNAIPAARRLPSPL